MFTLIQELWTKISPKSLYASSIELGNREQQTNKVSFWNTSNGLRGYEGLFRDSNRSMGTTNQRLLDFADESVKLLTASPKGTFKKKIGDWQLYAEAIFLRKKECLTCHKSMKLNDPIAVSAFAYKKR